MWLFSQRSQANLSESTPLVGQIEADPVEAAHYRRYQYYTRYPVPSPTSMAVDPDPDGSAFIFPL